MTTSIVESIAQDIISESRNVKAWGFTTFANAYNKLAEQQVAAKKEVPVLECGMTGYFESLVKMKVDAAFASVDVHGREVLVYPTVFGNVVLFRRYSDKGNMVITTNCPDQLRIMIPSGNLSHNEDAVHLITGTVGDHIGVSVDRLKEAFDKLK